MLSPRSPSNRFSLFFFLMNRPPPRSTLFPYTTLFRSENGDEDAAVHLRGGDARPFARTTFPVIRFVDPSERVERRIRAAHGSGSPASVNAARTLTEDRKSTRLNSSHGYNSYAVFFLKKKKPECEHAEKTNMPLSRTRTETNRSSMMSGSASQERPSVARRTCPGNPTSYGVTRGTSPL